MMMMIMTSVTSMSKPAPGSFPRKGPAPCSCCGDENPRMFQGTDGTVYCITCSMRGGRQLGKGCPQCNDDPTIVTRLFRVEF